MLKWKKQDIWIIEKHQLNTNSRSLSWTYTKEEFVERKDEVENELNQHSADQNYYLVDLRGFEPLTSAMPWRHSSHLSYRPVRHSVRYRNGKCKS